MIERSCACLVYHSVDFVYSGVVEKLLVTCDKQVGRYEGLELYYNPGVGSLDFAFRYWGCRYWQERVWKGSGVLAFGIPSAES